MYGFFFFGDYVNCRFVFVEKNFFDISFDVFDIFMNGCVDNFLKCICSFSLFFCFVVKDFFDILVYSIGVNFFLEIVDILGV